jgi:hypothetical protein
MGWDGEAATADREKEEAAAACFCRSDETLAFLNKFRILRYPSKCSMNKFCLSRSLVRPPSLVLVLNSYFYKLALVHVLVIESG